jgi:hypothetical protein
MDFLLTPPRTDTSALESLATQPANSVYSSDIAFVVASGVPSSLTSEVPALPTASVSL